jgi:hypothetical protein
MKNPKFKSQIPNKFQTPKPQNGRGEQPLGFGIWSFFGFWNLGFGIFL